MFYKINIKHEYMRNYTYLTSKFPEQDDIKSGAQHLLTDFVRKNFNKELYFFSRSPAVKKVFNCKKKNIKHFEKRFTK